MLLSFTALTSERIPTFAGDTTHHLPIMSGDVPEKKEISADTANDGIAVTAAHDEYVSTLPLYPRHGNRTLNERQCARQAYK